MKSVVPKPQYSLSDRRREANIANKAVFLRTTKVRPNSLQFLVTPDTEPIRNQHRLVNSERKSPILSNYLTATSGTQTGPEKINKATQRSPEQTPNLSSHINSIPVQFKNQQMETHNWIRQDMTIIEKNREESKPQPVIPRSMKSKGVEKRISEWIQNEVMLRFLVRSQAHKDPNEKASDSLSPEEFKVNKGLKSDGTQNDIHPIQDIKKSGVDYESVISSKVQKDTEGQVSNNISHEEVEDIKNDIDSVQELEESVVDHQARPHQDIEEIDKKVCDIIRREDVVEDEDIKIGTKNDFHSLQKVVKSDIDHPQSQTQKDMFSDIIRREQINQSMPRSIYNQDTKEKTSDSENRADENMEIRSEKLSQNDVPSNQDIIESGVDYESDFISETREKSPQPIVTPLETVQNEGNGTEQKHKNHEQETEKHKADLGDDTNAEKALLVREKIVEQIFTQTEGLGVESSSLYNEGPQDVSIMKKLENTNPKHTICDSIGIQTEESSVPQVIISQTLHTLNASTSPAESLIGEGEKIDYSQKIVKFDVCTNTNHEAPPEVLLHGGPRDIPLQFTGLITEQEVNETKESSSVNISSEFNSTSINMTPGNTSNSATGNSAVISF